MSVISDNTIVSDNEGYKVVSNKDDCIEIMRKDGNKRKMEVKPREKRKEEKEISK